MATGTLYTYPGNFRAYKALIAAKYSDAKITVADEPPSFKFSETNKTDDFLKKFPLGKVPAFEAEDGTCIFESNAIARFVANGKLHGDSVVSAALVDQWINFADNEILPSACTWVFPCLGFTQFNKQNTEAAKENIRRALGVLNTYLKTRTYLVGERISQADITVCCNLLLLYQHVLEPAFRGAFTNVNRWFTTLINQPNFKSVIGDFKMCEKMAQFDSKKYAELNKKPDSGKKEQKKQKQEPKKKEKKETKKDDEEGEEEVVALPPPKPKDPFQALPPSTFNFESWKRLYFNAKDTAGEAMPYFWENFDKENCCLYKCSHKSEYKEELKTHDFMLSNLVGGWFQRLDSVRKYGFGSVCVFGETKNYTELSGVFCSLGKQPYFEIHTGLSCTDHESYDWEVLDPDNEDVRNMVNKYFIQDESVFTDKKFAFAKSFH